MLGGYSSNSPDREEERRVKELELPESKEHGWES
jgi:hypothetical protein